MVYDPTHLLICCRYQHFFALQRTTIICMDCNRLVEASSGSRLCYVKVCKVHSQIYIFYEKVHFASDVYWRNRPFRHRFTYLQNRIRWNWDFQIQVGFSLVWTFDFQMAYPCLNISLQSISEAAETFLNVQLSK